MIRREPPRRRPRFGFTLVELLIVIVIIGILISLLLPVIVASVRKAREAAVSADIQTIALGLAKFKDTYGEFPPSRIVLSEQGIYTTTGSGANSNGTAVGPFQADFTTALAGVGSGSWYGTTTPTNFGTPDVSFGELAQRSLNFLRKMFPKAALGPETATGFWPDFNGNNALDTGFIYLEGHECLVFFLGGIPNPTFNGNGTILYGTSGFGKEPRYPFKNSGTGAFESTTNRMAPSYEFRPERLSDTDGDGIPGYLDANATKGVGQFYAYFASYGAAGYDPNDMNTGDGGDLTIGTNYRVGLPTVPAGNTVYSPCPNPYTSSLPTPIDGSGNFNANQPASYINVNSFQIISSGGDGLFGPGGQWTSSGDHLPIPPVPPYADQTLVRPTEADNLTSFAGGRLGGN